MNLATTQHKLKGALAAMKMAIDNI
jgi:hypothetical protein